MTKDTPSGTLSVTSVRRIEGRAILTLSNGERLSMPRSMLKERPYKAGMPFDQEKHDIFLQNRSYSFAMEKAAAFLASRARTEKELVDALRKNAYPESAIARVMAYLTEAGYINDAEFAQQWTAARAGKGLGRQRIRTELRQKGVCQDEIDEAIGELDEETLLLGAVKAAEKAAKGKDLSSPAGRQKVLAALARRGYDYALAKEALEQVCSK